MLKKNLLVIISIFIVSLTGCAPSANSRSYHNDNLENLFEYSSTYLDPIDNLWKPAGGDRVHLARIVLPEGGFVEFSLPVTSVFFYFEKSQYRSAKSFIRRKQPAQSVHEYLETGFEFVYAQDPGPDSSMGFGQGFTPPIVALLLEGPCVLENIVYETP